VTPAATWGNALFIDHAILRFGWRNWGVVAPGRLYRCNHPLPWQRRLAARRHGIRTIINLRGNVVTVLDTRKLLDLATSDITDSSRIMIIESGKVTVGLLVDSVAEVVNIASSDIDPPPSVGNDEGSRYIQGIYSTEQQILILIDLNKLINEENRDAIGMF
jgi:chemotaxis signal transduction protein